MASQFTNRPKILKGAFVEYGISLPPLILTFQFNPETLTRRKTASREGQANLGYSARDVSFSSLFSMEAESSMTRVQRETIDLDIRLDATEGMDEGDSLAEQFGIAPQLSALELMIYPKSQSLMGAAVDALISVAGGETSFGFANTSRIPVVLFIWGRKRVLPVFITSMNIEEQEFTPELNPYRANVRVSLEVIEGPNLPYLYSKGMKEAMAALNLANIGDIAHTLVQF